LAVLDDPRPRCTVSIVTYNCSALVADCLRSLERQRNDVALRVVVVDNASSDDTVQAIRRDHPWVEVIASRQNRGFAWATNEALRGDDAEYVLLLNPDTIVPNGALRSSIRELIARPNVGTLGCRLERTDGTLDHACKRGQPTPSASLYYFLGLHRVFPRSARFAKYTAGAQPSDQEGFVDAVNGAFMLIRRRALDDVGLMDERFWLYMEDLDWCRRSWRAGWPILYWPGVTVTHIKGGTDGGTRSPVAAAAFWRSMWFYYDKHERPTRLITTTVAVRLALAFAGRASGMRAHRRRAGT
jgi:GT2 family glycosyltransferase